MADSAIPAVVGSTVGGWVAAINTVIGLINGRFASRPYVWANSTARLAQTGMTVGEYGYQTDTQVTYRATSSTATVPWSSPWITYTPTLTNITLGAGSVTRYRYRYEQGMVRDEYFIQLGTSGMAMGSTPTKTLPVTASTNASTPSFRAADGNVYAFDSSTLASHIIAALITSATVVRFSTPGYSTTAPAGISSTAPFTWAASDVIFGSNLYEPA